VLSSRRRNATDAIQLMCGQCKREGLIEHLIHARIAATHSHDPQRSEGRDSLLNAGNFRPMHELCCYACRLRPVAPVELARCVVGTYVGAVTEDSSFLTVGDAFAKELFSTRPIVNQHRVEQRVAVCSGGLFFEIVLQGQRETPVECFVSGGIAGA